MFKKAFSGLAALSLLLMPVGSVFAATVGANLIANPSLETGVATPDSWLQGSWGTNNAAFTYENDGHTGAKSAKTTISTYTDGDAKWYFPDIAVTGGTTYQYSNWYKSDVATQVDVQVTNTDGTMTYQVLANAPASASWAQVSGMFVAPATAVSVIFYQALSSAGTLQIDDASLTTYTSDQFSRALVSLTFDDTWRDQYTNGLPILDRYGFKATFYALTGALTYPDYMDETMIQGLFNDGQEVGAHTVSHTSLPTLTTAQVDQELSEPKIMLQNLLGTTAALNFATPYGEYNASVINQIKTYYRSHRSVDEGYNTKDNFDIYNIRVQNILDSTTPAQVAAWVAQAQADKAWLVLVYHQVLADPSAAEENYSVTPANLDAELALIQQSGIAVRTVNQALDEIVPQLGVQPPQPPAVKPGDVNGDNLVDALDLSTVLSNWNKTAATRAQGDVNTDGTVDALDLSTLLINWSK